MIGIVTEVVEKSNIKDIAIIEDFNAYLTEIYSISALVEDYTSIYYEIKKIKTFVKLKINKYNYIFSKLKLKGCPIRAPDNFKTEIDKNMNFNNQLEQAA
jgi:hypothetical protein